jgi:hypothetical protein
MKLQSLFIILLCLFESLNNTNAQPIKLGLRFEPGLLVVKQNNQFQNSLIFFNAYGNILFDPLEWFSIEARSGLTHESEDYSGF